ncbi:restriction endonuclease [Lactobacillus sp. CBA3606]|uniref:restriction endonuclease n=1 Tax=Lactobacillus sp. CBA3606 TaxID=2099789 RepID=UPI000CFADFE7|nr:restriction endonuclease [Lactobacillus sp. CBA3606]AVK64693.1 restriction endonuclease [Lactobacillus sp. CBA3606]
MSYYQEAKKSSDGQPVWDSYLPIILIVIQEKPVWRSRDLKIAAVERMDVPATLRMKRYQKSKYDDNIAENRAGFSLSLLKNAGLVDFLGAAKYAQNSAGNKFINQYAGDITEKRVLNLPAYQAHQQLIEERRQKKQQQAVQVADNLATVADNDLPIDGKMHRLQEQYNDAIANELLERIWQMNPYRFENLLVELLVAMGYKGDQGSAFVTKKSNDNGIDGVINQDPLGTQTVYVQAKRYSKTNLVQRPEMASFYGAIAENHSNKGVFITSSAFTKGALATAKQLGILTIDGIQLTDLMVQYQVGVRIRYRYDLYDVDEDFFEVD